MAGEARCGPARKRRWGGDGAQHGLGRPSGRRSRRSAWGGDEEAPAWGGDEEAPAETGVGMRRRGQAPMPRSDLDQGEAEEGASRSSGGVALGHGEGRRPNRPGVREWVGWADWLLRPTGLRPSRGGCLLFLFPFLQFLFYICSGLLIA